MARPDPVWLTFGACASDPLDAEKKWQVRKLLFKTTTMTGSEPNSASQIEQQIEKLAEAIALGALSAGVEKPFFHGYIVRLLAGKVAVITGAGSTIGKEIATKFVKHGATVILTDLPNKFSVCKDKADDLKATKTLAGTKGMAIAMDCDVRDAGSIAKLIDTARSQSRHGRLDIFYNNAGLNGDVSSTDIHNFKNNMAVNVESVLEIIKQAGAAMSKSNGGDGGCILCTGSTMGVLGDVVPSAYSISKAALVGVVRAAAAELAADGVRVNAISPSLVAPRFNPAVLQRRFFHSAGDDAKLREMIKKYVGDRVVTAEHVAKAALYLASEASEGVTGHNLVLNGGEFTYSSIAA